MIIGTVKEIKPHEYRVGLTPASVLAYVKAGHRVLVETHAGVESGFPDEMYMEAGALIYQDAASVWHEAEMMVKVKEPLASEYQYFKKRLILYTFLHLAADEALTKALLEHQVTGVAYETIEEHNMLPCLEPMSAVAGRLAAIQGAKYLEKPQGGMGLLVSGVPGTKRANAVVLGCGTVGMNAIQMLIGMGANVTAIDIDIRKLETLDQLYGNQVQTLYSNEHHIKEALTDADIIIGAVLVRGAKAPKLIRRSYYSHMKKGAVIVDVAIDQGGATEVSKMTYHHDPIYVVDDIIHYCVANMPGAVPHTSTEALNHTTLKYGLKIAKEGIIEAAKHSKPICKGINTFNGHITYEGVSEAFDLPFQRFEDISLKKHN
jgi:alanine dehydrogenase